MSERLDLTVPAVMQPEVSVAEYNISSLTFNWEVNKIVISLVSDNGVRKTVGYADAEAETMMIALNKVNLSTKSLQKRIFERLVADGHLVGTISGSPD